MKWASNLLPFVAQNINGLVFLGGLCVMLSGVDALSAPAARIIGGTIVMAIGLTPYVLLWRKGSQ